MAKKRDNRFCVNQDEMENMVQDIKEISSHEIMGERGSIENAVMILQLYEWRQLRILMERQFFANNPSEHDSPQTKGLVRNPWQCNTCDNAYKTRDELLLHFSTDHVPQMPEAVGSTTVMPPVRKNA